jgi:hypothetical protein
MTINIRGKKNLKKTNKSRIINQNIKRILRINIKSHPPESMCQTTL